MPEMDLARIRAGLLGLNDAPWYAGRSRDLAGAYDRAEKLDAERMARYIFAETDQEHWHAREAFVTALPPSGSVLVRWTMPNKLTSGEFGGTFYLPAETRMRFMAWFLEDRGPGGIAAFAARSRGLVAPENVAALVAVRLWEEALGLISAPLPFVLRYAVGHDDRMIASPDGRMILDIWGEGGAVASAFDWIEGLLYVPLMAFSQIRMREREGMPPR
jgi:hypothetical protein